MSAKGLLLTLGLALVWQSEAMAGAHNVAYSQKSALPGTQFTLGGTTFDIVRVPIRLFSGESYALIVPASRSDPEFSHLNLQVQHSSDPFVSNVTISSFPAHVAVTDGRFYSLTGNVGGTAAASAVDSSGGVQADLVIGGTTFNVGTYVSMTVTIKLGSTRVRYSIQLDRDLLQTNVGVGSAYNIVPFAEWAKYKDPTDLVKALNDLVDYIRVIPL